MGTGALFSSTKGSHNSLKTAGLALDLSCSAVSFFKNLFPISIIYSSTEVIHNCVIYRNISFFILWTEVQKDKKADVCIMCETKQHFVAKHRVLFD